MPYICLTRTDVPDGVLQILDLKPNTSQRNLIYEPPGQTKYVSFRPQNDVVVTHQPGGGGTAIKTAATYRGLAAYLIDTIEDTPNGDALTAVQANTIAGNIITNILNAAGAATTTTINAQIAAVVAGSGIGQGNSIGTLIGFLRVLSGDEYLLPYDSTVDSNGTTFVATAAGSFIQRVRHTYPSGYLQISLGSGHLSEFIKPTYTYRGTAGRAVVVYNDDGTVLG